MTGMTLGSLCSGYEGLGMAIAQVLDVELAWVADDDPGSAAVLAHRHPDVVNLGDITRVDWSTVAPVDVVAAGFPCQDLSYAGQGAGIKEGTRSGLWFSIANALGVLRPSLVVLENTRAIVTRRPGLDVVLGDLAALGFDADWCCVRASEVGAPHQRERWFLVAHSQDERHERGRGAWGRWPGPEDGGIAAADTARTGREAGGEGLPRTGTAPDAPGDGRDEGGAEPAGQLWGSDAPVCGDVVADSDRGGLAGDEERDCREEAGLQTPRRDDADGRVLGWGNYGPAIERWARILGRAAPDPTEPAPRGGRRLSPAFVEWLMGLPAGHVTAVPGLTRNQQLRLLGNGVVPQQGAFGIAECLARSGLFDARAAGTSAGPEVAA